MGWTCSLESDAFVLRHHPPLPGLSDVGFVGRTLRVGGGPLRDKRVVELEQVHGPTVREVGSPGRFETCDGAITRDSDLWLTVRTADCLPVVLTEGRGTLALLHAGWRGLAAGIIERAIESFSDPTAVRAVLGPAIGPCCFEVGDDVARRFAAGSRRTGPRGKFHVDLGRDAQDRLLNAGLVPDAISSPGPCTRCHQNILYSHRGSGGGPGRIIAFAALAQ